MKKIIALVLAVALSLSMASVVFAADYGVHSSVSSLADADFEVNAGDKIKVHVDDFKAVTNNAGDLTADYFSTDYFTIKVDYERGRDLVKEVKFDGAFVVITLKDDVLKRPSISNFQIKNITLTGKKDGVEDSDTTGKFRNKKYDIDEADLKKAIKVGYEEVSYTMNDSDFDIMASSYDDQIVKFKAGDVDYGTATIDFDKASVEVRIYKNEAFFLGTNGDADLDIVKANPDADIEFLNFIGAPTFSANANVEIFADEDTFLYEIKDGKLVKSSLKYDDDAAAFVGRVRTLGKFVISDIELVAAAVEGEDKNPETGANDVVGVAVALAVVSLVAAGAVSMKKK